MLGRGRNKASVVSRCKLWVGVGGGGAGDRGIGWDVEREPDFHALPRD